MWRAQPQFPKRTRGRGQLEPSVRHARFVQSCRSRLAKAGRTASLRSRIFRPLCLPDDPLTVLETNLASSCIALETAQDSTHSEATRLILAEAATEDFSATVAVELTPRFGAVSLD